MSPTVAARSHPNLVKKRNRASRNHQPEGERASTPILRRRLLGVTTDPECSVSPGRPRQRLDIVPQSAPIPAGQILFNTPPGPQSAGAAPDSNRCPEDWYVMFLVSNAGVPSVAHWGTLQ